MHDFGAARLRCAVEKKSANSSWCGPLGLTTMLCVSGIVRADALAVVQALRASGCGGVAPAVQPLRRNARLDDAARLWAAGATLGTAVGRSGYPAQSTAALHTSGPDDSANQTLRKSGCKNLMSSDLREVGVYRRGLETWLVLASPYTSVSQAQAPQVSARVLALVNEARARGARCGSRAYKPAGPLRQSDTLAKAAAGHATDMANNDYLEHRDKAGRSPADRVHALGYRERAVGENIARGPGSPEEVVQGWMNSPGHCENIMESRFTEMGVSYAPARSSRHELYWVQLLAVPRR